MTPEPTTPEEPDMVRTLTYTTIAGLAFILASALGNIVIIICQWTGVALLLFVAAAVGHRYLPLDGKGTQREDWPRWVKIVAGNLRAVAARFLPGWMV
jgi:hypothetical protein